MFPISSCLKGVRSRADLQILSVVLTYNAKTFGKCVWDLALLPRPLRIFHGRETGHVRLLQYPNFGARKIQLFQRSPAQRVLLAWQALELEVQGKLNPLHGRGGCLFLVSSPLLTASLKPEQSCALTWFLLSSASIYPAKKSFCCLWEPNPQEEPVTVTTPCPALAQSSPLRPGSVSSTTTVICRVGFFPLLFLIRG